MRRMFIEGHAMTVVAIWAAVAFLTVAFAAAPARAEVVTMAERIAQCGACHGKDGNSETELTPSLAGQPEFFLVNQIILFREGVRAIEPMRSLVKDLSDDDIVALAQYYTKLPPRRTAEPVDTELAKRGAELSAGLRCGSCHLPTLAGEEQMPRLAGQRIDYMLVQLKAYRDSTRSGADALMSNAVANIPDRDLAALAHYAASR